jgi:prepilin-type N-terminal cleavage/methylation domain-containing protein/prepilin-type processing-associated H-X9-DG protein
MKIQSFTLVEVLIAIAIIAVLSAIAVPAASAISARAKSASCLSNLRQIGIALQSYLAESDMQMPNLLAGRRGITDSGPVIDETLADYVADHSVFFCPADASIGKSSGTSYFWNPALNGQRTASLNFLEIADTPGRIPILSDKEGWHRYRDNRVNFLYADGHATSELQLFTGGE